MPNPIIYDNKLLNAPAIAAAAAWNGFGPGSALFACCTGGRESASLPEGFF
jgi:hypothetical protein